VQEWTRQIENWLAAEHDDPREGEWYAGRPVLVMANDYAIGLFNGDTGVVVREPGGDLRVVFTREGEPVSFAPRRLADVQTVHAMTVHRSQGSQFGRVTFVLPEADSPLSARVVVHGADQGADVRPAGGHRSGAPGRDLPARGQGQRVAAAAGRSLGVNNRWTTRIRISARVHPA
jgi:exodeoxyribonuclease V alpha subunit